MAKSAMPRNKPDPGPKTARSWPIRAFLGSVDTMNSAITVLLCALLAVMSVLGFAQVIFRYLIGSPLTWSEEVLRFALIWLPFLGAGLVVRQGMLVAVEIVLHTAPAPVARGLHWAVLVISAAFWGILLYYSVIMLSLVSGTRAGATEWPMSYVYLAIPVGSAFALVNTVATALDRATPEID